MGYITSPEGNTYSLTRIGGCKAFKGGFVLLGNGSDQALEFVETSDAVGIAWREALNASLVTARPGRPPAQVDWLKLAAGADHEWATKWAQEMGWEVPRQPSVPARAKKAATATDSTS